MEANTNKLTEHTKTHTDRHTHIGMKLTKTYSDCPLTLTFADFSSWKARWAVGTEPLLL